MEIPFTGGCACGAVRFECSAEPMAMYNCHCSGCQSASGSLFTSLLVLPSDRISISGRQQHFSRPVEGERHDHHAFCPTCGSPLFAASDAVPNLLLVHAVALDNPVWFNPVADIWTIDARPWVPMDRHIPKVYKTPPLLGNQFL